jgi:hypothetical protein
MHICQVDVRSAVAIATLINDGQTQCISNTLTKIRQTDYKIVGSSSLNWMNGASTVIAGRRLGPVGAYYRRPIAEADPA